MADSIPSLSTRLHGARVLLRPPTENDSLRISRALEQNAGHLRPWSPAPAPGSNPAAPLELVRSIANQRKQWRAGRTFAWLILDREKPQQLLGRITLSEIVRGPFQNAYVGYWTTRERGRRGIATEALELVCDFAFHQANLHRIQAAVMAANAASRRVLEKVGFRMEGVAERYLQINGRWEDHLMYALTSEERPAPAASAGLQGAQVGPRVERQAARPLAKPARQRP